MARNPLEIDLILQNICQFLDDRDFKTCRILNRQWRNALDREFLKRCEDLVAVGSKQPEHDEIAIYTLLEIASDLEHSHPMAHLIRRFQNFCLFEHQETNLRPHLYGFFKSFGKQIKKLSINSVGSVESIEDFVVITSCKFTPSVEKLFVELLDKTWNHVPLSIDPREKVVVTANVNKFMREFEIRIEDFNLTSASVENVPWLHILSLYPNLKTFRLSGWPHSGFKEIAKAIVELRKLDKTKWNLNELYLLDGPEKSSQWKTTDTGLAHCREVTDLLNTAGLCLKGVGFDDSIGILGLEFVENQRNTLTKIWLEAESTNANWPTLLSLKKLYIEETLNFTFLGKAPNLALLKLGTPIGSHILWPENPEIIPMLSLASFGSESIWEILDLRQLFLWMPNVTVLDMHLSDETFPVVCQQLKNLRELTLRGQELSDVGVCGHDNTDEGGDKKFNITDLKDLESFEMYHRRETPGLTEKSIVFGFLRLEKLRKLSLSMTSELNPDVMQSLKIKVANVYISVEPMD